MATAEGTQPRKNGFYFAFIVLCILAIQSFCQAEDTSNLNESDPNIQMAPAMAGSNQSPVTNFDPNAYHFLIYNPRGSEANIKNVMDKWGWSYTERNSDSGNHVTLADLQNHDILIVGWNAGGNTSGLSRDILAEGITGRVILSGHDADYHTNADLDAAETFLIQAIEFVLDGGGTGLITLGDTDSPPFSYLPTGWGVIPQSGGSQIVKTFTDEGLSSGVYDNLIPDDMCNWGTSYHDTFTLQDEIFVPFELGGESGKDIITVARMNKYGLRLTKADNLDPNVTPCVNLHDTFTYTILWNNTGSQTVPNVSLIDYLPKGVDFVGFTGSSASQPPAAPPADPNFVLSITDANGLDDITLPVGQSVRLYVAKETTNTNIYGFTLTLEVNSSDPNLGWIDNTEYDPNNPGTAEILATPRDTSFDYYGPGYTQQEGIQFSAVSFGNAMQDGNLASFLYTAIQPGYVTLTLINYATNSATLENIIIRQTDPNDPNYVPSEPNSINEPLVYPASSPTGSYDPLTHTITWMLGNISPGSSGSVSFQVSVNTASEPGGVLRNKAVLSNSEGNLAVAIERTNVCCWDNGGIIYVNRNATGSNAGTSWENAYVDLQDAIARINKCGGDQIWVAGAIYSPGNATTDTFTIPAGVSVYGGFAGNETSIDQRDIEAYPTILSGYINSTLQNETIVTMGNESLLDGFTVKEGERRGVLGQNADFAISNCTIEDIQQYGIYATGGNVSVNWSVIQKNEYDGIYHLGNNAKTLTVENCRVSENGQHGIYARLSIPVIRNSQISLNGTENSASYGLYLFYPRSGYAIYNNTIVYNANYGVYAVDPNAVVDIRNCVLWGNKLSSGEDQMTGSVTAHYSCVYDPNYPNQTTPDSNGNISCNPQFAYDGDPNVVIYHLLPTSPCIDRGDPATSCADQNDLDGQTRLMGNYVDMGADEIDPDCSDVYNAYDWNADGLVNMYEFNGFSQNWLAHDPNDPAIVDPNNPNHDYVTDPNSPGYIDPSRCEHWYSSAYRYNLSTAGDSIYSIDVADLMVLVEDAPWLWVACWRTDIREYQEQLANQQSMMMLSASLESQVSSELFETKSVSSAGTISALSATQSPEEESSVEEFDPVAEHEQIASLLKDIEVFIDAGGEDAQTWQEIKDLLEQSLTELEDMAIKTTEF
ncbi:MAG TPA: right-handed parallel beta-helix repeat-containing protein [Anaerohalosphaeraceae bacterium]|nr:right-handed parallel beta-helix repeat-containing protein [Anaerohalosphaeraceae bacterium]